MLQDGDHLRSEVGNDLILIDGLRPFCRATTDRRVLCFVARVCTVAGTELRSVVVREHQSRATIRGTAAISEPHGRQCLARNESGARRYHL